MSCHLTEDQPSIHDRLVSVSFGGRLAVHLLAGSTNCVATTTSAPFWTRPHGQRRNIDHALVADSGLSHRASMARYWLTRLEHRSTTLRRRWTIRSNAGGRSPVEPRRRRLRSSSAVKLLAAAPATRIASMAVHMRGAHGTRETALFGRHLRDAKAYEAAAVRRRSSRTPSPRASSGLRPAEHW